MNGNSLIGVCPLHTATGFCVQFGISKCEGLLNMVYQERIHLTTQGHRDSQDLTEAVAKIVSKSGIQSGTVHVFNVGSTASVGTIEFEPGLQKDLPEMLDQLLPPNPDYGHERAWQDGNGHSHLQATLLGPSLSVPVAQGQMALGTWQQVFHLECDVRPRQREVVVTVMGE
jgi:secondary thiamine-phosphate synthase enzyme